MLCDEGYRGALRGDAGAAAGAAELAVGAGEAAVVGARVAEMLDGRIRAEWSGAMSAPGGGQESYFHEYDPYSALYEP